jgi:flavodoxin
MSAIVIYSTQSNNTKKVADAVAEELGCESKNVKDAGDISGFDTVAVGFWYQAGQPDPASQKFLATLAGKKVFLFGTHGAAVGTPPAENGMNKAKELAAGANIVGTFSCPGEVGEKVLKMAAAKDPQPPWLAAAPDAKGHPDDTDLAAAKAAVKAVL